MLARGRVRQAVDDRAWLQAMLDVEAGLARAQARASLLPADHAEAIARACRADAFDLAALGRDAASGGNPVIPLVRALVHAVPGPAGAAVHTGATSQDILDSAAMLVAHRALGPLLDDLAGAATAAADLAAAHRATALAGRTLLQQALPVTFGFKAAGWLVALDEAAARLGEVRRTRLAVQLGGAVGTLASLGDAGTEVLTGLARELGLAEPVLPWHTVRTRVAELAGALGTAAGVAGKVARDVILLAQTEVAEVREGGPAGHGGSSTLPHKRNPVAAVAALASAEQAPGLVATLLAAMLQEHERAAGAWHAEWRPLTDLLRATGSAAAWLRDCLEHLEVDAGRMRRNLDLTGGLLLAERVTTALAPSLGRLDAHELVQRASAEAVASQRPFAEVLYDQPKVSDLLDPEEIGRLLDPAGYLGATDELISRALRAHAERGAKPA
ncbi:MAG TPA: 3-carboxy-cis,cis-muconate cycloisomerase [Actinomycetota bacterium]|nr:3-carboxy-cis,cis-muconate cycloisomerase [Actinomycetota bacterium]